MNEVTMKEKAIGFLQLVASGNVREAYEKYTDEGFFHHNPYFPGDRDSLMRAMEEDAAGNPDKMLEVKLAVEENNMVSVYSHVRQNPKDSGFAIVHIFRFREGRIIELWDLGQPVPEDSPNQHGMF